MGLSKEFLRFKKGKLNKITDVEGVFVGHSTISSENNKTGVTAIIPKENIFKEKLLAASHVINGFSKPQGLIQIDELGTIEAPIILTNTLSVGTCLTASVKYMLENNPEIGLTTGTINCPVLECNDMRLNDIRSLSVKEEDVFFALESASCDFEEGSVGAGTGMRCHELKGGIGSASRIVSFDRDYTIGVLVLTNHARYKELMIDGKYLKDIYKIEELEEKERVEKEAGSIIVIIATDIPMSSRILKRLSKRAMSGISRTGANSGNGSGEIALAFSTANKIYHGKDEFVEIKTIADDRTDEIFAATIDAVHEAIFSSMLHSDSMTGFNGYHVNSLRDIISKFSQYEHFLS